MGKIFLYMNMTLDGCLSGPNGELDWFDPSKLHKEMHDDIIDIVNSAKSWMMGYPTGPGMIAYWKNVGNKGRADKWEMEIARAVNKAAYNHNFKQTGKTGKRRRTNRFKS